MKSRFAVFAFLFAFLNVIAYAAGPAPVPPGAAQFKATQNGVTRTIAVRPPCVKCTATDITQGGLRKFSGGSLGGQMVQFSQAGGPVATDWIFPPPPSCPPVHPPETRPQDCSITNPGTHGTWSQSRTYTQGPFPGCVDTPGLWLPTVAPPDACAANPPPPGGFNIDLSYVNLASPEYAAFKAYVDARLAGDPDYGYSPVDAMYMFKITGDPKYAVSAISDVDLQVTLAEQTIAAGGVPDVAYDSYLYVGDNIGELAITYAWANSMLTPSQRARWAAFANQTMYNVWNCHSASWGGHPFPWSCWGTDDPFNNYYYSFLKASMWWALAANDATLLADLRTNRLPPLVAAMATLPGGGSLEGTGYGTSHVKVFELYQVWLDSGQGDLRNAHMTNTAELWVYATMPDMSHFDPIGDQSRVSNAPWYDYQRALVLEAAHLTTSPQARADVGYLLANLRDEDGDPYLRMRNSFNDRYGLIPYTPGAAPVALTFRAPEVGLVSARTGWSLDATALFVLMGTLDQSHAGQEQGGFTLFGARDWQAVAGNVVSHSGIRQETGDKNVIRFIRSGEDIEQRKNPASIVNVTTYTPNPVNGNLRIAGDLSPVYQDAGVHWTRIFDFVGGSTTISDSITLGSGVSALWQLQVPTQPTIAGNVVTAGHLRMTVLAPASVSITKTDMRTVDSDYNSGWRVQFPMPTGGAQVRLDVLP